MSSLKFSAYFITSEVEARSALNLPSLDPTLWNPTGCVVVVVAVSSGSVISHNISYVCYNISDFMFCLLPSVVVLHLVTT